MKLLIILLGVSAALASTPRVICTKTNSAVLGADVTLTCDFQSHLDVLQIAWQKKRGRNTQNMVTYSEKNGRNITKPFEKRVAILNTTSLTSSIRISKLEQKDEACYSCQFNVVPNGAYTGEVCLNFFESVIEVLCNSEGNGLRISLDPPEIMTHQSVQVIEKNIGATDVFTVKGQYSSADINPTCEFRLEKKNQSAQESQMKPAEDEVVFFTQCSASGAKKFIITWHDEGQPVSQEYKVTRTRNIMTVTSTLKYNASSLPANHSCSITCLSPEAEPENTTQGVKELTSGSVNKDDAKINEAQQPDFRIQNLMMISAGALFLVLLIALLLYYKPWKRIESKRPKNISKAKSGYLTPMDSFKKILMVPNISDSPECLIEDDLAKEIPDHL